MRDKLESVLYEFAETWFDAVRDKDTKTGIEAVETALTSIINLVDKSLPEKHVCTDECNINSREWIIGHKAYKDAESNAIDDMRAIIRGNDE